MPAKIIDPNAPPLILVGNTPRQLPDGPVKGDDQVTIDGEPYVCIRNVDGLKPFLMSVVSNTDHWLFVGSNTAIGAGRVDPDNALFPYVTADKMLDNPHSCGALAIFLVKHRDSEVLWTPWHPEGRVYKITRNIYKHAYGTSVIFEEINHTMGLRFRWSLAASEPYGLVRHCALENLAGKKVSVRYLDGWHLLLPPGVGQDLFSRFSYLAMAYMRNECLPQQALGIYALNSKVSDRAEPGESLRATCAWSVGHRNPAVLISNRQIETFRSGGKIEPENDVRGEFGAYLVADSVELGSGRTHEWFTVADHGLDHRALVNLKKQLDEPQKLKTALVASLEENVRGLKKRIAAADGLQQTADRAASIHHFANVMFNCMRGGTLNNGFAFPGPDFAAFIQARNSGIRAAHQEWLAQLPATMTLGELATQVAERNDPQLTRLAREYLPLSFSRRHGDPSRPWNRFSIQIKDAEGNPIYGYQGNWRDIFQNWESLAQSYPGCLQSMISVFLNASTADGYNPYRITRNGIDWEVHDHNDPWSHIGYWGDHQIIYLLRLLESYDRFEPGRLAAGLNERLYAYAMVPYEIGGFDAIARNPSHSITFNDSLHKELMARAAKTGGDGKLVQDAQGNVELVPLGEKLLVPVLVKLSNLIPGGGIWLNTQRPEWNDANNALAGWGLSMVTVYYVRRYLCFLDALLASTKETNLDLSKPVAEFLQQITTALRSIPADAPDAKTVHAIAAALGKAGETHRKAVYGHKLGERASVPVSTVREFIATALPAVDATIRANRREDGMYHAYNLLNMHGKQASVRHMYAMLEGQVAVLSSGTLKSDEALQVLKSLRESDLFRKDQYSYMLYPDREVAPFLARNTLPEGWETKAPLLAALVAAGDRKIIVPDDEGHAHFQADLTNPNDLIGRLDRLAADPEWADRVKRDRHAVMDIWESVFHHSSFTGRSGSMFAFEGLGCIYWHMNAKLLVAVQESLNRAIVSGAEDATIGELRAAYYDLRRGMGFTKTPDVYGAFPTDPYSHSPRHRGAQQPGMTGQVKEEILTRFGELGVEIAGGCLRFNPRNLRRSEFFKDTHVFAYVNTAGEETTWEQPAGSLAFTYCQVPVSYRQAEKASITLESPGKEPAVIDGNTLSREESTAIFTRDNTVSRVIVNVSREMLHE